MSGGSGSGAQGGGTRNVWKKLTPAGKSYHPFDSFHLLINRRLLVSKRLTDTLRNGAVGLDEAIGSGHVMPNAAQTSTHLHLRTCQELKPASVVWILEGVPNTYETKYVAWRTYCFLSDFKFRPGKVVTKVIDANAERLVEASSLYHQTRKNVSPDAVRYRHHDLYGMDDYLNMCSRVVSGTNYGDLAACREKQLHDRMNPANPFYVWDLQNAMNDIRDAHKDYVNIHNYYQNREGTRHFRFPHPKNCWRLTPDQASLASFTTFYSPVTKVPVADTDLDALLYRRLQTCTIPAPPSGEDEEDVYMSPMLVQVLAKDDPFKYLVGQRSDQDVAVTPERLARINKERRDAIVAKELVINSNDKLDAREKFDQCAKLYRDFERLALPELASVWNEFADISSEHKVLIKWGDEYLYRHKNFCGNQPKITSNLPLRAEGQVRLCSDAELVYEIYTAHAAFRAAYMAQLSALDPDRDDKIHYLGLGPPGKSKSFVLDRAKEIVIPRSITVVSYRSAKCDTGVKNMDGGVLEYHEFPNDHMVEVKGVVSEAANLFKDRSVRGMFSADILAYHPVTSERIKVPIEVYCNVSYLGNTNLAEHLVAAAVHDRFYKFRFTDQVRSDKSIHDTMASKDHNPYISAMRKQKNERHHVVHFLFAKTCRLIELGMLCRVNTAFCRWIVSQSLKRAEDQGMPPASSRTSKRIVKFATIQTILNAIDIVFNNPDTSPIMNEAADDKHFLLLAPFLYVSYQETALALGLMKASELDNRLHRDVIAAMILAFFPADDPDTVTAVGGSSSEPAPEPPSTTARMDKMNAKERIALLSKYHPDGDNAKDQDWLYAPNVFIRSSNKTLKASKKAQAEEQPPPAAAAAEDEKKQPGNVAQSHIEAAEAMRQEMDEVKSRQSMKDYQKLKLVASRVQARMNPRPDEEIVIDALRQMARTSVKSIDKPKQTVRMFELHEDGFRLATSAAVSLAHDVLEKALIEVLQWAKIRKGDVAFEEMQDERAFLFRCLHIDPDAAGNTISREVENPDFVDSRKMDFIQSQFVDARGDPTVKMELAFQSGRTTTIDADMEEVFFARHISNIKDELDKYNFGNAYHMTQVAREGAEKRLARTGKSLPHYPEQCFIPRGSRQLTDESDADKIKRPTRYSAKEELQMLTDARKRPAKIARVEAANDVAHNQGDAVEDEGGEEVHGFGRRKRR